MVMTNEEIVRDFNQSANRMKQIGILAELNGCTKQDIVAVLVDAGCEVPKNFLPKPKKAINIEELPEVPTVKAPQAQSRKNELELVAFRSIKNWLPPEECSGGDALVFVNKVQALLEFLEEVC